MPLIQDDRVSTPRSNSPVTTFRKDRERRELNVSKVIKDLFPDETPFLAITNEVAKEIITSQEIIWYDQKPGDWWTQASSDAASATTGATGVIDVNDSSIFRPRDLVKVTATGEVLLVNSIDETQDANKITVTRGYAGTTANTIPQGSWLMRIGNAMEQFSRAPEEKIVQPVRQHNYTQIFRTPFSESETSSREGVKTKENERKRLARLKLKEHVWDIERALIFGERFLDTAGQRSTMGGFLYFLRNRVVDAQDQFSEEFFDEFLEEAFAYGAKKKLFVCSRRLVTLISSFAKDRIETMPEQETYGIRLKKYIHPHGDLILAPSYVFEKDYDYTGVVVDVDNVKYKVSRDTTLVKNIQLPDEDGWRDEYKTEATLEVRLPQTHTVLVNASTKSLNGSNASSNGGT
jgi:hypothetical protein